MKSKESLHNIFNLKDTNAFQFDELLLMDTAVHLRLVGARWSGGDGRKLGERRTHLPLRLLSAFFSTIEIRAPTLPQHPRYFFLV